MEIVFILSSPAREENVGAAARAIKTMGIDRLRLVNPLCDHLGERALATAHGSRDVLEEAAVFASLPGAAADLSLLIGSAAKKRNIREDRHPLNELPEILKSKGGLIRRVGVVFGGEESGLSNRELDQCDLLTTIPMARKYPSLNLAQAVMVYASTLSVFTLDIAPKRQKPSTVDELEVVKEKAMQVLSDVEIPDNHIIHRRIMERLMMLEQDDMHLFHSFCKFYLKKYHGRVK
ncbi:MAG: TrmJ/YjtD family RNA methyltransferase [Bacteroidales bacterium]